MNVLQRYGIRGARAGGSRGPADPLRAPRNGVVVAGVDDSPAGLAAVDHARVEAELRRWDLRLLHVQPAGTARYPADGRAARLLERMTHRVHACAPTVAVSSHLAIGAAATELLAELSDTDLVVVGHRGVPARTAFGLRTGERVAACHPGPALVVRTTGPDLSGGPIVAATDDSPDGETVLAFARAEAELRGCDLVVVHTTGDSLVTQDPGSSVRVHHEVGTNDPVGALLAASSSATAVVTRRHNGAGRVVRDSPCPVFVVGAV